MNLRRLVLALTLTAIPLAVGAPRANGEDDETRGYVGFSWRPVPILTDPERKDLGVTVDEGIVVTDVVPGMPADLAGLKRSDLIRKYNGEDVPPTKGMDPKDADALKKVEDAFQKIAGAVKTGDKVELVVDRAGKPVTVAATAVNKATRDRLVAAAEEEQLAPKFPDLKSAGAPVAASWDFEAELPEGRYQPADFIPWRGVWEIAEEDGSKPVNNVLKQSSSAEPWAVCIVAGNGRAYTDGTVSVRFMPLSGHDDASGGILFRAQDRKSFYVARANALENNLTLAVVKDGKRKPIATVDVERPKMRAWHTLEVTFVGNKFKATLDGKSSVEGADDSFVSGWNGLWTKADSETQFDDMKMTPAPAK